MNLKEETKQRVEQIFQNLLLSTNINEMSSLLESSDIFQIKRNSILEHRFNLQKQISTEDMPKKINKSKGKSLLSKLSFAKMSNSNLKRIIWNMNWFSKLGTVFTTTPMNYLNYTSAVRKREMRV
jgi:hypothetical protein